MKGHLGPYPVIAARRHCVLHLLPTHALSALLSALILAALLYGSMWCVIGLSLAIAGAA